MIHLLIGKASLAGAPKAIKVEEYRVPPPIDPAAERSEKNVINITLNTSVIVVYPGNILKADEVRMFISDILINVEINF